MDGRLAALFYPQADTTTSGPPCCAGIGPLSIRSSSARGLQTAALGGGTQRYPNSCYSYSQFPDRYKSWCQLQKRPCARSTRRGKSSLSTTAGLMVPIVSPTTGEVRQAQVLVAVLGRCVQLHLCRGHLVPVTAGLAAKPCPCL